MLVDINDDEILDLMYNRVDEWTDVDYRHKELLKSMYEDYVYGKSFEEMKDFSVNIIVDNDIINYTKLITPEDKETYKECYKMLKNNIKEENYSKFIDDGYSFVIENWNEFYNSETGKNEVSFLIR